jgi:arylsulfatase A
MRLIFLLILIIPGILSDLSAENKSIPPNIIVIFCDDLGYADLSSYGSLWNQTPEIDQMATEGVRFTDFYAGAPVCTPSRTGLLTGCYARRVDMDLDAKNRWVLFPVAKKGINPKEYLLPEALKDGGYSTAIIGKWHLGDQPEFYPLNHGFDYWYGIPYSNDMEIEKRNDPPLPLMQNDKVIKQFKEWKVFDQSTLTKEYTDEAIKWIKKNKDNPFFLYLAHTMPHNPVNARDEFFSKTNNPKERFGAAVAEISWSTGEILETLKKENLDKNTLVIFTSDNGGQPRWGASNGILRGHKGQTWEGGIRVPFIAWWPGKIEPGTTCYEPASVIDFFATFTSLADVNVNDGNKRDGQDISDYLFNPEKERQPRPWFYWHVGYLEAVRYGDWKLSLLAQFSEVERQNMSKSTYNGTHFSDYLELYNLHEDPGENNNVADLNPEIVKEIIEMAEKERKALGEWTHKGPEVRKTLIIENPKPILK